jgi:hypothetical protein
LTAAELSTYLNVGDARAPSSGFDTRIQASVDHICSELKLAQLVRLRSFELSKDLKPETSDGIHSDIPESVINAVACALVSMAHEEALRMHRVSRHLPDRIIGRLYGLSSSAVVRNKQLISAVIIKKRMGEQKDTSRKITFR